MIRLAALALALMAGAASAQQHTMKLSTSTSGDALVEWLNTFAKGVNAASGGRIKAEVYPGSQLGSIPRTIEVSFNASGFYEPLEPRFAVLSAPGIFDSQEHGYKVLHDPAIRQRLSSFGAAKGVEPLTIFIPSQYVIVSHKPIHTLADFKGQKIRVPGSPLQIEPLKHFGASPLSMPFGEVLPALQNHTIDGVWAGTTLFTALKFYDVAKDMTYLPSHWAATVPLVNRNFIKSLGPELEKIVRTEADKADEHTLKWAADDIRKSERIWGEHGGKEIRLSSAEQKRFLDDSIAVAKPLLTATPQAKEDYEAFTAAANKYRK